MIFSKTTKTFTFFVTVDDKIKFTIVKCFLDFNKEDDFFKD